MTHNVRKDVAKGILHGIMLAGGRNNIVFLNTHMTLCLWFRVTNDIFDELVIVLKVFSEAS